MPVLIPVVHVWPAVIPEVFACPINPILKTLALDCLKLLRGHIPSTPFGLTHLAFRWAHWTLGLAHEVGHGESIAASEAVTVLFTQFGWEIRIAILIVVVDVWLTVIPIILARALDSIVKAAALNLT